jgi:hypothetical protein
MEEEERERGGEIRIKRGWIHVTPSRPIRSLR